MAVEALPRFEPDKSRLNPTGSRYIMNVRPTADGWTFLRALLGLGTALPSAPRGGLAIKTDDGTWRIFIGTATALYEYNTSTYAPVDVSRVGGYNLVDVYWDFTLFGTRVIATASGSDFPQYYDLATSSIFADLPNAAFEAELCWTAGDFLVFGRVNGNKRLLKWSATNNTEGWTLYKDGSDEQELPDGGQIMRGINQAQNALIIQESMIRRMNFDINNVFSFSVVDPERGAIAPRSVVNIAPGDFIYLSKSGFFRGLEAQPIGSQRVDEWFFEQVASDKIDLVSGVADPFQKVVWFRYEKDDGSNAMLGYDWHLDQWFPSDNDVAELMPAATAGISVDDADSFGTVDTVPFGPDSRFWQGGIQGFAGFTSDYKFAFFDGDTLEATIDTADKMLNYPRRAVTDKIRVVGDMDGFTVAIAARETQGQVISWGNDVEPVSGLNWATEQVSGYIHRFRIKVPAGTDWGNRGQLIGIDVSFIDGGEY